MEFFLQSKVNNCTFNTIRFSMGAAFEITEYVHVYFTLIYWIRLHAVAIDGYKWWLAQCIVMKCIKWLLFSYFFVASIEDTNIGN